MLGVFRMLNALMCAHDILRLVTEAGSLTSLARSPITNQMVEIKSIVMSGETCSILNRNVFGDE
jgi:hypothetical protein